MRRDRSILLLLCAIGCSNPPSSSEPSSPAPPRLTMEALHQAGGVPPGWRFTPPAGNAVAGRQAFIDSGCHSCHAVQGEQFPSAAGDAGTSGPDLTGMGSHHPADYFVESILNPDAVLVEGPGYISESGHSTMPSYPDMSLKQLADVVAYLKSLGGGGSHEGHAHMQATGGSVAASASTASAFFAQAYEVPDERLDDFYRWFEHAEFRSYAGLVSIDTYASRQRDGQHVILCVFGFDSEVTVNRFIEHLRTAPARAEDFARPVDQYLLQTPAVYRAPQMSTP